MIDKHTLENITRNLYDIDGLTLDQARFKLHVIKSSLERELANQPKCAGCPNPDGNPLTMGYAGGNEVHLCPTCKRQAEERS